MDKRHEGADSVNKVLTALTCLSAFIIGHLNVYSIKFNEGTFVSAQTGNLTNLGIMVSEGDFSSLGSNMLLLFGFGMGCTVGTALLRKFQESSNRYLLAWMVFAMPIWINGAFVAFIPRWGSVLLLSFTGGAGLCFFRTMGTMDLNNTIMTGNLKNMWALFYEGFALREWGKLFHGLAFFIITALFFLGCLISGLISSSLLFICVIALLPLPVLWYNKAKVGEADD